MSSPPAAAPIGIFDSGVGGLHVMAAIRRRLPGVPLLYLGDTARLPYGSKSADVVRAYARRCAEFLLAHGARTLVVACNTASAHAAEALAGALPVPVIGVIQAGAEAALAASRGGAVAVLATHGTLESGSYRRAVARHDPARRVVDVACPLWVPLAEEDMAGHPAARLIVEGDLAAPLAAGCDTLLLACTHYPVLMPLVAAARDCLWGAAGRPPAAIVEGSAAVAARVGAAIGPAASGGAPADPAQPAILWATDASPRLWSLGERLLGAPLPPVRRVDI